MPACIALARLRDAGRASSSNCVRWHPLGALAQGTVVVHPPVRVLCNGFTNAPPNVQSCRSEHPRNRRHPRFARPGRSQSRRTLKDLESSTGHGYLILMGYVHGAGRVSGLGVIVVAVALLSACAQSYPIPRAPDGDPIEAAKALSDAPDSVRASHADASCGKFVLGQEKPSRPKRSSAWLRPSRRASPRNSPGAPHHRRRPDRLVCIRRE